MVVRRRLVLPAAVVSSALSLLLALSLFGSSGGGPSPLRASPLRDLNYPQTYGGEGELTFQIYPEFVPPAYRYYLIVGSETDTSLRFDHGYPYRINHGASLGGVTNLHVADAGTYTVGYSGAGMAAVAVIPEEWRVYGVPDLLAAYDGRFPPGWFALLLMHPDSASSTHLEVIPAFEVPVTVALFALDEGLEWRGWLEEATSGSLRTPLSGHELALTIHVFNPTDEVILGGLQVVPFTPPFAPDASVTLAVLVVAGAISVVAVILAVEWRRARRQRRGASPP